MKKVLLVVTNDAYGRQIARWAEILKEQGLWEPIVYFRFDYMSRHFNGCKKKGIIVLSPTSLNIEDNFDRKQNCSIYRYILDNIKNILKRIPGISQFANLYSNVMGSFIMWPFKVRLNIISMNKQIQLIHKLFCQYPVNAVIISESSPMYGAPLFIHTAHSEGIPVVTTPIDKESAYHLAENFLSNTILSLNRPLNRIVGFFFPNWVICHKGHRMVPVEPELLLAYEFHHIKFPNPWISVGNQENLILLDSQASYSHYLKEGFSQNQMAIIGAAEHDIMFNASLDNKNKKTELYAKLGLLPELPMILSPLVQSHYLSGRPECDFQDYEKMVKFWVKSLGAIKGYNVIINLHPSQTYQQDENKWKYIEQWGVKICNQDIASLIPLCDIYVAAGSSTIAWAIACGKPIVNYDIYRWGHGSRYQSVRGVFNVQEQEDFLNILTRLTSDTNFFSNAVMGLKECSNYWGEIDGKVCDRLVKELENHENDNRNVCRKQQLCHATIRSK